MTIVMGRILEHNETAVLIEGYGVYEDWYDEANEDCRKWVAKRHIEAINDEQIEEMSEYTRLQLTGQVLEISLPDHIADKIIN